MVSPVSPMPASLETGMGPLHPPSEEEIEVDMSTAMLDDPIVGSRSSLGTSRGQVLEEHDHFLIQSP